MGRTNPCAVRTPQRVGAPAFQRWGPEAQCCSASRGASSARICIMEALLQIPSHGEGRSAR
eukprot:13879375-Alexandrium_andersonii.AAC.1